MRGGYLYPSLVHSLEDARHQDHANSVAQFSVLEPKVCNLPKHLIAIFMATGTPTGGKRNLEFHK